jgi:hypothetical protein
VLPCAGKGGEMFNLLFIAFVILVIVMVQNERKRKEGR